MPYTKAGELKTGEVVYFAKKESDKEESRDMELWGTLTPKPGGGDDYTRLSDLGMNESIRYSADPDTPIAETQKVWRDYVTQELAKITKEEFLAKSLGP